MSRALEEEHGMSGAGKHGRRGRAGRRRTGVVRRRRGSVAAVLASLSLFGLTDGGGAQEGVVAPDGPVIERAIPGPVRPPVFFERAVDRGTRSPDGSPGESYWHNWSVCPA